MTDQPTAGLHQRYSVGKNGEPQDGCLILKPESDPAAQIALEAYADATENDDLESDLREWIQATDGGADAD